jgi:hypothetical protein
MISGKFSVFTDHPITRDHPIFFLILFISAKVFPSRLRAFLSLI